MSEARVVEVVRRRACNLAALYGKNPWSLRRAYNWRSRCLPGSSEVTTRLPTWNGDSGRLDVSFFHHVNDNVPIGLQVKSIANAVTHLATGPRRYPSDGPLDTTVCDRAWFMNDRRYPAVLRASW